MPNRYEFGFVAWAMSCQFADRLQTSNDDLWMTPEWGLRT
jgi:hypothetical protein